MAGLFAALSPPEVFYPVFVLLTAFWFLLRALIRRRVGPARWESRVHGLEQTVLAVLILGMVTAAVLQIVLRNLFHTGLLWIDPLLRHLVLWIGFTAAVVASGRLRHIHMDVIGRFLPLPARRPLVRFTALVAALICALLARAAWLFLADEQAFGSRGMLGIPVWLLTGVIFLGFALMAVRFTTRGLEHRAGLAPRIEKEARGGA